MLIALIATLQLRRKKGNFSVVFLFLKELVALLFQKSIYQVYSESSFFLKIKYFLARSFFLLHLLFLDLRVQR